MRAGSLRQRLQLQSVSGQTDDGIGGKVGGTWTTVATVWGQVDPMTGTEQLQALQVTASIAHQITIRYRGSVTPKMRLVRPLGGQVYEIRGVMNVDLRNRQLELLCTEAQTAGA